MLRWRTLLLTLGTLAVLALALAFFLPLTMERSIPFWLKHQAEKSGALLTIESVRAPLLRPVSLQNIRLSKNGVDGAHIEIIIPRAEATMNLLALLGLNREHSLRSLQMKGVTVVLRSRTPDAARPFDWSTFQALLPDEFDIAAPRLSLTQMSGSVEIQDAKITGSRRGNGEISAAMVEVRAPFLRRAFHQVHGITRWQDERLTLASISLLEGFSIESSTFDLSRLDQQRLANDSAIRTFGGTIRVKLATEREADRRIWDAAGSASGISLGSLANALGVVEPVRGSLRASKFTFHGDPRDLVHASGSIWMELIGFGWRGRSAESIMVGANYYARTIQLQQLFIRQRVNELTVNGETNLGENWLSPDFHGDVNASIADLSAFAELFGAKPGAFKGKLSARGRVHAYERRIDGNLAITGDALNILARSVDTLTARLSIDGTRVTLDQFDLKRGDDQLHAEGARDFAGAHPFHFKIEAKAKALEKYNVELPLLGKITGAFSLAGEIAGDNTKSQGKLNAQTNGFTVSSQTSGATKAPTIDELKIEAGGASASFSGALDLAKQTATLKPAANVHADFPLADAICGVTLTTSDSGAAFTTLELSTSELVVDQTRHLQLCAGENDAPLHFFVAPTPPPPAP
ncbi:MAG: hypothetical protein M3R59_04405 [Verrucomicrobiota bacterium]|nr:hypothetical protein [Verrucomicrobiota bacterium]